MHSQIFPRTGAVAVAAVLLVVATGCASATHSAAAGASADRSAPVIGGTSTPSGTSGQSVSGCPAPSTVSSALGVQVSKVDHEDGIPEAFGVTQAWGCYYDDLVVHIDYATGAGPDTLAKWKKLYFGSGTVTDLRGFMDDAFTINSSIGNSLVARKGTKLLAIQAAASVENEKALEEKLFDTF